MKHIAVIASLLLYVCSLTAQSTRGLTGIADTSFSTYSAYFSAKKKYPDIRIAEEVHSRVVKEKYNIPYCIIGERKLLLDVFTPRKRQEAKGVAIIILFGGGWRSGNRAQHYPLAERLATLGYVCFTPEYRLSTEALYPAAVHDVKSSVRWVRKHAKEFNIDSEKISLLGFSAGGELAAFASATNNDPAYEGNNCTINTSSPANALIDIDGTLSFVHPESGEGDDSKKISAASYWFGFSKKDNIDLWKQASPLTHAGQSAPPTLFINSSLDRMHAGRNEYINILNGYNTYSEVHLFENSPHTFCLFHPWFEPTIKYIDDFLKKIY